MLIKNTLNQSIRDRMIPFISFMETVSPKKGAVCLDDGTYIIAETQDVFVDQLAVLIAETHGRKSVAFHGLPEGDYRLESLSYRIGFDFEGFEETLLVMQIAVTSDPDAKFIEQIENMEIKPVFTLYNLDDSMLDCSTYTVDFCFLIDRNDEENFTKKATQMIAGVVANSGYFTTTPPSMLEAA